MKSKTLICQKSPLSEVTIVLTGKIISLLAQLVMNLSKAKHKFMQSLFFKTYDAVVSIQLFLSA